MTDTPTALPALPKDKTITWRDRKIKVRFPQPEQLLIFQRMMTRMTSLKDDPDLTADKVMQAMERARKIIDSMIVQEADVEWLDDRMLDGSVGLKEASEIIIKAVQAYGKPKTTKTTTARRKKAS